MKDIRFNKAINNVRKISMTPVEKQIMLERILGTTANLPIKKESYFKEPIKSPWTIYSFSNWIKGHQLVSVIAVILIIALSGNGIVLAANNSLPGDVLYPLKVNVSEPIKIALISDPIKKAEVKTELVQKRFEEAETLAINDKLDVVTQDKVTRRVRTQVDDLNDDIKNVEKISVEKADDVSATLEASVRTHDRVLVMINGRRGVVSNARSIQDSGNMIQEAKTTNSIIPKVTKKLNQPAVTTSIPKKEKENDDQGSETTLQAPVFMSAPSVSTTSSASDNSNKKLRKNSESVSTTTKASGSSIDGSDNINVQNVGNDLSVDSERAIRLEQNIQHKEAEFFKKAQDRLNQADKNAELSGRSAMRKSQAFC
ncbi:MAG: DUF5667 domain-containing protein [Patescibacteria group bacterium]